MKKNILIAACLLPIALMAQNKFTIKGKVGNLGSPAKAYLYLGATLRQPIDSANITDGKFTFSGTTAGIGQALIRINPAAKPTPNAIKRGAFEFYLEPKTIELVSATNEIEDAVIKNSKVNDENEAYKAMLKTIGHSTNNPENGQASTSKVNMAQRKTMIKEFYNKHLHSYIGLVAFRSVAKFDADIQETEADFNKFSAQVKATEMGKKLERRIKAAKETAIGQMTTDFTLNDEKGKPVKLSDFHGKYVLLDFWASWCGPCRLENPNLIKAYNTFKSKNFTVLGVALEKTTAKENWLQAIKKDGLPWTNVADIRDHPNSVAKMYNVGHIPANFLIDPSGKIVAKNLKGEALQQKLAEIL